jgi:adenylosuccinate lyase
MIPDVFNLVAYVTKRLTNILNNLYVNEAKMLKNIEVANEIFYSQPLLTYILIHKDFSREEVYDFIQAATLTAMQENKNFKEVLKANGIEKFISLAELDQIFKLDVFLKNVDQIYQKVQVEEK